MIAQGIELRRSQIVDWRKRIGCVTTSVRRVKVAFASGCPLQHVFAEAHSQPRRVVLEARLRQAAA